MLNVKDIQKSYGNQDVLDGISFSLSHGEKAALVGANGTGKTTLLRIIAGLESPDSGHITLNKSTSVGYLPQFLDYSGSTSIHDYVREFVGIDELEREKDELEQDLVDGQNMERYLEICAEYDHLNGYSFDTRMTILLEGFGLGEISVETSLDMLSGGQKSKVVLTAVLLKGVDLLLLDEPTNNLDIFALRWLEYFIKNTRAACIIVSHDRTFLDSVVGKVFEIDYHRRTISLFHGLYSDFLLYKESELGREIEEYRLKKIELNRLKSAVSKATGWGRKGEKQGSSDNDKMARDFRRNRSSKSLGKAKSIEKRIGRMGELEKPLEKDSLVIPLEASHEKGSKSIILTNVKAGYEEGFVTEALNLQINFGDRLALIGENGSGKSTILNTISGLIPPIDGVVRVGPKVVFGNLVQEHRVLDLSQTMLEFMVVGGVSLQESHHLIDRFGFSQYEVHKRLKDLSPGGRVRLLLAMFAGISANVLILDEPTNHLDLDGLTALEAVLNSYQGTVVLVSHDRYFLEKFNPSRVYQVASCSIRTSSLDIYDNSSTDKRFRRLVRRLKTS